METLRRLRSPLVWGVVATASYVLGLFLFLGWIGNHPWRPLDLNEAGDFFAGAFAPLAFVWLVVAVFLQKQELQAQREQLEQQMQELRLSREELRLNRHELELNRQVLGEQAEELRAQSKALERQVSAVEETKAIRDIDARIERFITDAKLELQHFQWHFAANQGQTIFSYYTDPTPNMLSNDQFAEACRELTSRIKRIPNTTLWQTRDISKLITRIDSIEKDTRKSAGLRDYFSNYELNNLRSELERISLLSVRRP